MVFTVFPLRLIITQVLALFLVIAIEAFLFHKALNISPRLGLEYAASINLFAAVMGWLMFFVWESLLSPPARVSLITCIFLSQCQKIWLSSFTVEFIIFFISFFWKWLAFYILRFFWLGNLPFKLNPQIFYKQVYQILRKRIKLLSLEAWVVLLSHLCSHYALLIILIIEQNYF